MAPPTRQPLLQRPWRGASWSSEAVRTSVAGTLSRPAFCLTARRAVAAAACVALALSLASGASSRTPLAGRAFWTPLRTMLGTYKEQGRLSATVRVRFASALRLGTPVLRLQRAKVTMFGQFAATSQFYLHGRKHFTKTGYEKHRESYETPDLLETLTDLSDRVYIVTGANSGIGKEISTYLAKKGASVYMVCRNKERAEAARKEVEDASQNQKVKILEADVGVEADVRRCWQEFSAQSPRLDALVCNAGALLNTKTLTSEGLETTFASHFMFGTYLLGSLAMPTLKATKDSRFIAVSSGGMYNTAFPSWDVATAMSKNPKFKYDGQLAYAYAKRGQVILCERWGAEFPEVKVVSCHPGWTGTPAVDSAYGDQKKYLEPLRTPWEGAEGICWLCVSPAEKIESGAFYLDRSPQVKHMAGPFFTEGSFTKNKPEEIDAMMKHLDDWTNGRKPEDLQEKNEILADAVEARQNPLTAMERPIELSSFMGRWFVAANIPTFADRDTVNNIEDYSYDEASKTIMVTFSYSNKEMTKTSQLLQKAKVENESNTRWSLSPKIGVYLPLKIPYLLADVNEDFTQAIVGVPDRSYIWIMTRETNPEPSLVEAMIKKAERLGYDTSKLVLVPQDWTAGAPPAPGTLR
mmetsp:Transcript_79915/g.258983  ORF Transcript_79915/g.258983 Transcript_79915/m.258983 type:complete len:637 (+) Transcript_79915:88-1998(+)